MNMKRICDNCGEKLKDKIIGEVCPWNNPDLKSYNGMHGYIGSMNRTIRSDKFLMRVQKELNIPDKILVNKFLIHSAGRKTMDDYSSKMSDSEIYQDFFITLKNINDW